MSGIWNLIRETMEARETDKLFRDKLKNLESAPKADSWNTLESMLDKKEAAAWYAHWRVAAIALLLIFSAAVLILWNQSGNELPNEVAETIVKPSESDQSNNSIAPEVLEVEQQEEVQEAPPKDEPHPAQPEVKEKKTVKQKSTTETSVKKQQSAPEKKEEVQPEKEGQSQRIDADETMLADVITPELKAEDVAEESPVTKEKKRMPIRITYKRGNAPVQRQDDFIARQKTDTTGGRLKEFLAQTREFNPGDLWADIREAKHNLFQKKENSKKNNVKNLNK